VADTPDQTIDIDAVREGAEEAVRAASAAIRAVLQQRTVKVGYKDFGEGPVTEADYAADAILRERLVPLIEGARWLSEESSEVAPLIRGEPTWVVDPLDGTREFLRGLPEFGVSVGLFVGDELVFGVVGLPVQDEVYSGLIWGDRLEARKDGVPLPLLPNDGIVEQVVVSRHDYEDRRIGYMLPWKSYPVGSAVLKLVYAATRPTHVYFSTGPRSVWDVAGGAALLMATGGMLMMVNGKTLRLSPQQIGIPPYAAGAPADCRVLLSELGVKFDD